jgi:hypothetical protein
MAVLHIEMQIEKRFCPGMVSGKSLDLIVKK